MASGDVILDFETQGIASGDDVTIVSGPLSIKGSIRQNAWSAHIGSSYSVPWSGFSNENAFVELDVKVNLHSKNPDKDAPMQRDKQYRIQITEV